MTNHITLTGNMAAPVELRFTPNGKAVASLRLADTPRRRNASGEWEDAGETVWVDVSVWEAEAEALAERAGNYKGRATVTGTLGVRTWEDRDGVKRQQLTIRADSVTLHAGRQRDGGRSHAPADDPWAQGATYRNDEPSF